MVKRHLSRLAAPKSWPVKRKGIKFITKPLPGSHNLKTSMSLRTIMVELLKIVSNAKEAKQILNNGYVKVNSKVVKNNRYSIGIFDVISFDKIDKHYRLLFKKTGRLFLKEIDKKEANLKPVKILNKKILPKGKIQINFSDGSNVLVEKDIYRTNDTLVMDTNKNQIKEHIPFEKGALIYFIGGKKIATVGKFEDLKKFKGLQKDNIIFKKNGEMFETSKRHAFVIGKKEPVINIENE